MFGFTKTKFGILVASSIFFVLILLGELSPIGDFLPKNGITRDDVAKYRIHILSIPNLKKISSKETSLNITAELKQLGRSKYFRASGGESFYAYFNLTNDWDFDELEPHHLKKLFNKLTPIYSLDYLDGNLFLQKLDQNYRSIDLKTEEIEDPDIMVFNNNRSALMTWNSKKEKVVTLLKDISKSPLEYPNFKGDISKFVIDKFGSRIYAVSLKGKETKNATISYVDTVSDAKEPIQLDTVLSKNSQVEYSAIAKSICVLDNTRLRILNADTGAVIKILYLESFLKNSTRNIKTDSPHFQVLEKVPAAFLEDHLIDLRDGSTVDVLPGSTSKSIYAIDYENKNLYFSSVENDGSKSMNIATYDLHNLRLSQQIQLGSKNSQESERNERNDYLKVMFIDEGKKLVALSAPKD